MERMGEVGDSVVLKAEAANGPSTRPSPVPTNQEAILSGRMRVPPFIGLPARLLEEIFYASLIIR